MQKIRFCREKLHIVCGALLIPLLVLTACGKSQNYDAVNTDIVASVNGELIDREELMEQAESYENADAALYEDLLEALIDEKLAFQQAEAKGLSQLTPEELAEVDASVSQEIAQRFQYYYEQIRGNYPEADEKSLTSYTQNAVAAYVAESGETEDELTRQYSEAKVLEKLYDSVTEGVTVTEEEIIARYEAYVTEDQARYTEHPDYFESDKTTNAVYYNLPGHRYVKHIRFSTREAAEAALARAQTEDFDALMEELTEDTASLSYPQGFAVGEGSSLYIEGFAEAAMALQQPGDLSEVLPLEDGFYIIKYIRPIPAGPEELSQMRQYVENDLLGEKRSARYAEALTEWREAAEIDIFRNILENLYEETENVK